MQGRHHIPLLTLIILTTAFRMAQSTTIIQTLKETLQNAMLEHISNPIDKRANLRVLGSSVTGGPVTEAGVIIICVVFAILLICFIVIKRYGNRPENQAPLQSSDNGGKYNEIQMQPLGEVTLTQGQDSNRV